MTNALLLRLFTSEYFNAWIAISYIFRYPDNVGIQHYLCNQLRKFPIAEIEFFIPQLMHLLISRPTESVALEHYIIDICEKSTHVAVMCLWYLQAYLSDLSTNPSSASFQLCKRVLNRCQAIIFNNENPNQPKLNKPQRVRENTFPALVGIGAMLAGIGQPLVTKPVGNVAIAQGRKAILSCLNSISASIISRRNSVSDDDTRPNLLSNNYVSISLEDLHKGKAFSASKYLKEKMSVKSTMITHDLNAPSQLLKGMNEANMSAMAASSIPTMANLPSSSTASPCLSTRTSDEGPPRCNSSIDFIHHDNCSSSSSGSSSSSNSDDDEMYAKLSLVDRRHLLRSNYFRSEMQFILALVDIASRLVIVPKPARLSALHAELTLLNHNLPAVICMPLWCPATVDKPHHHRVVRISPNDAVVLNSAERVPYLLLIEVLDDELSLENGFKSSSSLKKIHPKQQQDNDDGDLGSAKSSRRGSIELIEPIKKIDATVKAFAERMKTAAILLAQLQTDKPQPQQDPHAENIRLKIIREMMALEDERMEKMTKEGVVMGGHVDLDMDIVVNKEDPSAAVFSEDWETKKTRIRAASPYGHLPNWKLISVIVKNGADLRQEQFAIQLIREMQKIWQDTQVHVWVQYIRVLVTSDDSGLIETVKNAISIHSIKKEAHTRKWNQPGSIYSLKDYYTRRWGPVDGERYKKAQDAFMRSLAGYSIASYLLQIKDRHNGNLLIDDAGHIVHIDFGFMLSNSPGSVGFEMAPFKLPQEYIDILGGVNSEKFGEYRELMKQGFLAIRKHHENILLLTEMMSKDSRLPCFQNGGQHALLALRERFQLQLTEPQIDSFVDKLIMSSCCNVFTKLYDTFQYYSQGIL